MEGQGQHCLTSFTTRATNYPLVVVGLNDSWFLLQLHEKEGKKLLLFRSTAKDKKEDRQ
jgi:hypothetical protein